MAIPLSGTLCRLWLVLLLLVMSARALPIPAVPPASVVLTVCLSVIPSSLVFLLVAKVVYMKNRRIHSIHTHSSFSTIRFPFLIGFLGSPDWEIKMKRSIARASRLERSRSFSHTPTFQSCSGTFSLVDEFGVPYATRWISACPRSLLPSLPPLAHIPSSSANSSGLSLPILPITDFSPLSMKDPSDECTRIRLVSVNKSSYDCPSFLPVTLNSSPLLRKIQNIDHNAIPSPPKLKTKYSLYRKTPPLPFLPVQTPPDSPLSWHEPPIQNSVFHFTSTKDSSPVVMQRISHPYAQSQPAYDFPRSPQHSYDNQDSPTCGESPTSRTCSLKSSPYQVQTRTPLGVVTRALNLANKSHFFSSISADTPTFCSDKPNLGSKPTGNLKLIPFSSVESCKLTSDSSRLNPGYTHGNNPATLYEFTSPLRSERSAPSAITQTANLYDRRGLGILTPDEENGMSEGNGASRGRKRKTQSALFSIPEEDVQFRSSKSSKRLSSANSHTWRNSWNTACGDVEIAFTALSAPIAPVGARRDLTRVGAVDDDLLLVDEADDGEEGSRTCLIGLLEELEEWGCEWVDSKDLPTSERNVGVAW